MLLQAPVRGQHKIGLELSIHVYISNHVKLAQWNPADGASAPTPEKNVRELSLTAHQQKVLVTRAILPEGFLYP